MKASVVPWGTFHGHPWNLSIALTFIYTEFFFFSFFRLLKYYWKQICSLKGDIGYKNHFYMVFEIKCVLAVCVQNHPIMIKIHPVFFFFLSPHTISTFSEQAIHRFCAKGHHFAKAPPTTVDGHWRFSTNRPWVSSVGSEQIRQI